MVYTLLIHDDRYSAPSLYLLTVDDDDRATALAQARLQESDHHYGVELWYEDRLILKIDADNAAKLEANVAAKPSKAGPR